MLDQLFGIIMLGLGIQSPMTPPSVKGDQVEQSQSNSGDESDHSENENESEDEDTSEDEHESDDEGSGSTGSTGAKTEIESKSSSGANQRREQYKNELEKRKTLLEATRKQAEIQYKAKREALKAELLQRKPVLDAKRSTPDGEFKKKLEEEREAFKANIQAKIEQAKADRETKLATLKAKVEAFQDEAKKTKVESIQTRLLAYVAKRLEVMTAQITKMNDMVGANKSQVSERAAGKDTSAFDAAAADALTALNTAKDTLATLSSKQYVVTINSESSAKSDVESVRKMVETDMKSAQDRMRLARVAVSTMIRERAKLLGEAIPDAVIK